MTIQYLTPAWRGLSMADLLRLPGLVFSVLCIHQLWSFSGQKNQRVTLWTCSVKKKKEGIQRKQLSKKVL